MAKADDIINEILELIDQRVNKFNDKMPDLQKQTYAVVLDLASELETTDGVIKPTVKNIKTIARIKSELNKVIFTKEYTDELDDLIKTYEEVTKLQNQYFTSAIGKFTVPAVLKEVQNLAQQSVVDSLGEDAIGANFVSPIRDILVKNVTTGGSRAEFIEQARDFILGQDGTDGKLVKYTGQIVTDSLNQYSRNYAQTISNDLGLEWYMYVGSNKETTRDFCKALTAASKTCLPYIHKSQLPEIISGKICGEQVPIYDKTGLPYGMIPGTNVANFETNVGGYRCNHALRAVSSALVPKELRDRFERGIVDEEDVVQPVEEQQIQEQETIKIPTVKNSRASKELKLTFGESDLTPELLRGVLPDQIFMVSDNGKLEYTFEGSFYDSNTKVTNVGRYSQRALNSDTYVERVSIHEFNHRIHYEKGIFNDEIGSRFYNPETNRVEYKKLTELQEVHMNYFKQAKEITFNKYPDEYDEMPSTLVLDNLMNKYKEKYPQLKESDIAEFSLSYLDAVQSLTDGRLGMGHDYDYWQMYNKTRQPMEWFAHAGENYWYGNPIFQEEFPELYDFMNNYYSKEIIDKYLKNYKK